MDKMKRELLSTGFYIYNDEDTYRNYQAAVLKKIKIVTFSENASLPCGGLDVIGIL